VPEASGTRLSSFAMWKLPFLSLALALGLSPGPQEGVQGPVREPTPAEKELIARLAEQGVSLDPVQGYCAFAVDVLVRDDLLEYLLVGPAGAVHESGFVTEVPGSVLNVAMLALGAEPGRNAEFRPKDPQPTLEELRAGAKRFDVTPPSGDSLYLYVGWKSGEEVHFFRLEDLIRNLAAGQSMRRHSWVYLGSQMVPSGKKDGSEVFAADLYQNLICIAFFREGHTLLTGALPECVDQGIWMLNSWLLPERGTRLEMFASNARLDAPTPRMIELLPEVEPPTGEPRKR
jgi:hypothetical protein